MPFDYHDNTSVINDNYHTLTLAIPIVRDGSGDLSNYWSKEELVPLTRADLDEITGCASTVESFKQILANSNEVMLDENLSFAEPIIINKNFTIDLNKKKITSVIDAPLFNVDSGTLTLKNGIVDVANCIGSAHNGGKIIIESGSYNTDDVAFNIIGTGSKITMTSGEITAVEGGIGCFDGAEVVINGGTITVDNNFVIYTADTIERGNNTIMVNGGTLVGNTNSANYEACGVYIANNDTFIMNGGAITANGGCGLLMRAGNVTISDGTITAATGPNVPGYVGDNAKQMNASAVIYDEASNYPGKDGMSLTINGGQFIGFDHSVEILSNEVTPNVTITGGTFYPAYHEE